MAINGITGATNKQIHFAHTNRVAGVLRGYCLRTAWAQRKEPRQAIVLPRLELPCRWCHVDGRVGSPTIVSLACLPWSSSDCRVTSFGRHGLAAKPRGNRLLLSSVPQGLWGNGGGFHHWPGPGRRRTATGGGRGSFFQDRLNGCFRGRT